MKYKELLSLAKKYPNCCSLNHFSIHSDQYKNNVSAERFERLMEDAYRKVSR